MNAFTKEMLRALPEQAGIHFPGAQDWLRQPLPGGGYGPIAMDAQPTMVTTSNAGIPAFLSTFIDPKLIEVLTTPNKAAAIYGETKKGDWTTETAMFPMVESTGEVSSYGDYSDNGRVGVNWQYPQRQAYLFQTFTEWGERELERAGLGRIDLAARLNIASALTLSKAANFYYFYGVAGLQNYGALNDPSLSAALTPATKVAGGTSWNNAAPTEIAADIQFMVRTAQTQTGSNVELDDPMTLALHSQSEVNLLNTNSFGISAIEIIKKQFPNIKVVQAPQFLSGTTYACQLIIESVQGQKTIECGFNEKLRAHAIIQGSSSWKQKKTAGTWGALIYFPAGIVSMSGI